MFSVYSMDGPGYRCQGCLDLRRVATSAGWQDCPDCQVPFPAPVPRRRAVYVVRAVTPDGDEHELTGKFEDTESALRAGERACRRSRAARWAALWAWRLTGYVPAEDLPADAVELVVYGRGGGGDGRVLAREIRDAPAAAAV